jgi:hypothetical protein
MNATTIKIIIGVAIAILICVGAFRCSNSILKLQEQTQADVANCEVTGDAWINQRGILKLYLIYQCPDGMMRIRQKLGG